MTKISTVHQEADMHHLKKIYEVSLMKFDINQEFESDFSLFLFTVKKSTQSKQRQNACLYSLNIQ